MSDQENDPWFEPVEDPDASHRPSRPPQPAPPTGPPSGGGGGVDRRWLFGAGGAIAVVVVVVVVIVASGGGNKHNGSSTVASTPKTTASNTSTSSGTATSDAGTGTGDTGTSSTGTGTGTTGAGTTGTGTSTGSAGAGSSGGTSAGTVQVSASSNPTEWKQLFDLYNNLGTFAEGNGGNPADLFAAGIVLKGLNSPPDGSGGCENVLGRSAVATNFGEWTAAQEGVTVNTPDSFPVTAGDQSDFSASITVGSKQLPTQFQTVNVNGQWLISRITAPCF